MVEIVLLLAAAGVGSTTLALFVGQRIVQADAWRQAARACGVTQVVRHGWPLRVSGRAGGLRVAFRRCSRLPTAFFASERQEYGTRIVVSGVTADVALKHELRATGGDVEIGDDAFDFALRLWGPRPLLLALFDAPTRRRALDLFAVRLGVDARTERTTADVTWLSRGELVVECPDRGEGGAADTLAAYLGEMLALARALDPPRDVAARLATNARADPLPAVRLANLTELVEGWRERPETRLALTSALEDEDERVQLFAAGALGAAGRPTMLAIATREWSSDACTARAVAQLRAHLSGEQVAAILARALRTRREQTVEACLDSLGHRGRAHVADIARVLGLEGGSRAQAAARALATTASTEAEAPLVAALKRADEAVRAAAAEALGRVGTAAAVASLREAEAQHPRDAALRTATRQSIASIQSRLSGASEGQLSLSEEAGQLSLADDAAGRVSLAPRRPEPAE